VRSLDDRSGLGFEWYREGSRRWIGLTEPEYGKVVPLGDLNDRGLRRPVVSKILRQLLPQQARMRSDDAVFAAVISGRSLEDMHPNLLFGCRLWRFLYSAVGDVQQKFA